MNRPPPVPFFILRGHEGNVTALRFCYEKDHALKVQPTLLSGSDNGEIFIWNLQNFRALYRLNYCKKICIMSIDYYKSKLLSQSKDGTITIWIYDNNKWNITNKFESKTVGFCASYFWFVEEKAYISLYDQEDNCFSIYDVNEEKRAKLLNAELSAGLCMCFKVVKVNKMWISIMGYENGDIVLFDIESNTKKNAINVHKELVTCLDFDYQKEMRGISGSADEFLKIWKVNKNHQLESVHQVKLSAPGVSDIKIRNDAKIVIIAEWDSSIRIFSWKSLKSLVTLFFHDQLVQSLACSLVPVDNKVSVFASGSKDKNIALWDIY